MKKSLLQLACAAAIGALAMSAQAQYSAPAPATQPASPAATTPSPSTSSQMGVTDGKSQPDADYKAAQAKCNTLTGDAKANCLNDAKAAHDRAVGPTSDATPPNTEAPAAGNITKKQ